MNASRQSIIVSAIICIVMAALFAVRYCLAPYTAEAPFEGGMPLAGALTRFSAARPVIAACIAACIVVWTLAVVVQLTVKFTPAASRNYLPAQIFLIGAGGLIVSGEALTALLASWLTALAIRQFVFSLNKLPRFSEVFHAGFFMGLLPLLYAPAAAIAPAACVAAIVIYRRSVREAAVCFVGLLLPSALAAVAFRVAGAGWEFVFTEMWRCTLGSPRIALPAAPYSALLPAACILTLALVGALWALAHEKGIRKTAFKLMQHTSFILLFVSGSAAVPGSSITLLGSIALICSLCVPYAFHGKLAGFSTVLYSLIVASAAAINLAAIFGIATP